MLARGPGESGVSVWQKTVSWPKSSSKRQPIETCANFVKPEFQSSHGGVPAQRETRH